MAIDSVAAFLDSIRQFNLLEPTQITEAAQEGRRHTDARALAQQFIRKNWLTPYQVNEIFRGQTGSLVLGQYRLLERLGEGGMGQVFKARHQTMGRIVAVKVIRKERLENEKAVRRFRREIQAAAALSHPNVAIAFDADAVNGSHFLVMEYVDGVDLSRLVKQKGPLPIQTACEYIRQTALGLQHAHERGLIHRDIKPGNLVVTKGDQPLNGPAGALARGKRTGGQGGKPLVKILDMGLARLTEMAEDSTAISLSHDGTVMGTPDYMSPEQAKNSHRVDWRADIYSLGCTFYYLLTGSVPFPNCTNIEKLVRHQMDQPKPAEQLRADIPPAVRPILQKMMAKRVEDRIQTAGDVATALAPFCEGATNAPKPAPPSVRVAAITPAPVADARPGGPPTMSSTIAAIRNFFYDAEHHKARRIGLVIGVVALIGLLSMFLLVLSLISGWAGNKPKTDPAVASVRQTTKTPATTRPSAMPTTPVVAKTPPTERRGTLEPVTRYLPEMTNNVFAFKVREIFQSRIFQDHDNTIKANLSSFFLLLQPYGIDLYKDVERIAYAVVPATNSDTLVGFIAFQGSFERSKFQEVVDRGGQKLRQRRAGKAGGGLMFYERPGESGEASDYLAMPNANTFLYTTDPRLMINVFVKQNGNRPLELNDKEVQQQLSNLDDKPAIFLTLGGSLGAQSGKSLRDGGIRYLTCAFRPGAEVEAEYTLAATGGPSFQRLRTDGAPLLHQLLKQIDGNGILADGLASVMPAFNEKDYTIVTRVRYTAADIGKVLKRPS